MGRESEEGGWVWLIYRVGLPFIVVVVVVVAWRQIVVPLVVLQEAVKDKSSSASCF